MQGSSNYTNENYSNLFFIHGHKLMKRTCSQTNNEKFQAIQLHQGGSDKK